MEKRTKGQTLRNTLKPIISPATSPTHAISVERSPGQEMDYDIIKSKSILNLYRVIFLTGTPLNLLSVGR